MVREYFSNDESKQKTKSNFQNKFYLLNTNTKDDGFMN